jgi:hypothetical protein
MLERAKAIVDARTEDAYRGIRGKYLLWEEEWGGRYGDLMDDLNGYATGAQARLMREIRSNGISPDGLVPERRLPARSCRAGATERTLPRLRPTAGRELLRRWRRCFSVRAFRDVHGAGEQRRMPRGRAGGAMGVDLLAELRSSEPKMRMVVLHTFWIKL